MAQNVTLENLSLGEIMHMSPAIKIPPYQRIYCWDENNVIHLLDDLQNSGQEYRLGSIILSTTEDGYDIVDGQQRLVTLTLLLSALGYSSDNLPLLNQKFLGTEAKAYIEYNYAVIKNYIGQTNYRFENILDSVTFSVLKINAKTIDLAFTFFSNTNSRGVALSDYDLLKAHHLRYLPLEEQQKHLAKRWNSMVLKEDSVAKREDRSYVRALEVYIYCLRKWLRKNPVNEQQEYRIKNEYQTAPFIEEIPPFCEQFQYKEPIQGGSHFFGYVEHFVTRLAHFRSTKEYEAIHGDGIDRRSHWWFRDVIEANLFAYYLKFEEEYLPEALMLITRVISQYRLEEGRVRRQTLLNQFVGNTEITILIDQATSPTFFLAEMLNKVKGFMHLEELRGIRLQYRVIMNNLMRIEYKRCTSELIKNYFGQNGEYKDIQ